jgi:hypothetical protein
MEEQKTMEGEYRDPVKKREELERLTVDRGFLAESRAAVTEKYHRAREIHEEET